MNDLARPALYGAWHDFEAVRPSNRRMTANIVGPICETGDTFAMGRDIEGVPDVGTQLQNMINLNPKVLVVANRTLAGRGLIDAIASMMPGSIPAPLPTTIAA